MKTNVTAAMKTHLAGSATTICSMWKVKRKDNVIMGFTDHDRDLTIDIGDGDGSVIYKASTGYQRSAISFNSNFEADSLEINSFLDSTAITETDIARGRYDYAIVTIFAVNHQDLTMGKILIRKGWAGALSRKGKMLVVELLGLLKAADREILRTIQPLCNANLGDIRCGVDTSGAVGVGTVITTVVSSREFISAGFPAEAQPGSYKYGFVNWKVGATFFGDKSWIKSWDNATKKFTLAFPLPSLPLVGDPFEIKVGCDKTLATCIARFNNRSRFRGFPHVPTLDSSLGIGHINDLQNVTIEV